MSSVKECKKIIKANEKEKKMKGKAKAKKLKGQVLNPATNRMDKKDGAIGRRILGKSKPRAKRAKKPKKEKEEEAPVAPPRARRGLKKEKADFEKRKAPPKKKKRKFIVRNAGQPPRKLSGQKGVDTMGYPDVN